MRVIKPGMLTTVQDLGRYRYQKYGVVVGGAMDSFALRVANLLVGNAEGEAALEITLHGPQLEIEEDGWLAICGASLSPTLDGQPVPEWRPFFAPKGSMLAFGRPLAGCRAYLAVAGGFAVAPVLGSKSTYLRAGIGGGFGRALLAGDRLSIPPGSSARARAFAHSFRKASGRRILAMANWFVSRSMLPAYRAAPTIRVMAGHEFPLFREASRHALLTQPFVVSPQSDRMGYRLQGAPLSLQQPGELVSTAVTAGTVQVPADGQPIILMADRQTTGGYPRIAQVATVDLPVVAQLRPGDRLRFTQIDVTEAQAQLRRQERDIAQLRCGIQLVYGGI